MTSEQRHEARYQRRKAERLKHRAVYQKTYDEVFTYENLYKAYRKCILGVGWKTSIQSVRAQAPVYIYDIYDIMRKDKYRMSRYVEFDIFERGKPRHIQSVYIRDRIIQRCLADNLIVPTLTRSFIYDSGACIKGKGIHFQRQRFKQQILDFIKINGRQGYILQYDFSKFFANLDHDTVKRLIRKYIDDGKCLAMIDNFVDSFEGDKGLGLGSEMSYLFALMVANELDHFVKEKLGCKQYGRYMDDGYLFCRSLDEAKEWLKAIEAKCKELHIVLNKNKTQIVKLTHCFIFLKRKYRITNTGKVIVTPLNITFTQMRRKLIKLAKMLQNGVLAWSDIHSSFESWKSSLKGTNSHNRLILVQRVYTEIKRSWLNGADNRKCTCDSYTVERCISNNY